MGRIEDIESRLDYLEATKESVITHIDSAPVSEYTYTARGGKIAVDAFFLPEAGTEYIVTVNGVETARGNDNFLALEHDTAAVNRLKIVATGGELRKKIVLRARGLRSI